MYGKVIEQNTRLTVDDDNTKDYLVRQRRREKSRSILIVYN